MQAPVEPIESASVGPVFFAKMSLSDAVNWFLANISEQRRGLRQGESLRFANAWCVVMATQDPQYAGVLNGAGITFADGTPVARSMQGSRGGRRFRVRGPSFFEECLDKGRAIRLKHYFYGASEVTISNLVRSVESRYPGVIVVGAESPPFGSVQVLTNESVVERLSASEADVIWIGLGSPKQDLVAAEVSRQTGIMSAAIGAAFDFLAGTTQEAPRWVQQAGMEWLFRLVSEPRRLWRRYLLGNFQFLWIVTKTGFGGRNASRRRSG